jgi:hypothetical protein
MRKLYLFIFIGLLFLSTNVMASDLNPINKEVKKYITYAVMLGRSSSCDIDNRLESEEVSNWFDRTFIMGSNKYKRHIKVFSKIEKKSQIQQRKRKSPDTCEDIKQQMGEIVWPSK